MQQERRAEVWCMNGEGKGCRGGCKEKNHSDTGQREREDRIFDSFHVAARVEERHETRNEETGEGEEGDKKQDDAPPPSDGGNIRDLTKRVGNLKQMNEDRSASSPDDRIGKAEWRWENSSWWLRVRTGKDMNARSRKDFAKHLIEQEARGNEDGMERREATMGKKGTRKMHDGGRS